MKYLRHYTPLFLLVLFALASLGCGLTSRLAGSSQQPEDAPTRTPFPTFTPTPAGGTFIDVAVVNNQQINENPQQTEPALPAPAVEQHAAEPTPTSTLIVLPTDTPTPTPAVPSITLVQNMNVRSGPGTDYPIIGGGSTGDSANIIGRNADASWVQVEFPTSGDGTGWLFVPLVKLNGDVEAIAVAQVAPPPPPPPTPTPPEPEGPAPTPKPSYQFRPLGFYGTPNAGIVHFKGRIKTEEGALVNGYSVLVDNGAWSVVSHPTGASHHYPEKGDGEWDVVIPNIASGIGWWWLTVVKYECPDFLSRFDAQCKQFTRLSEDIKMEVVYPDKMVINADWICRKDCDQGLYVNAYRR